MTEELRNKLLSIEIHLKGRSNNSNFYDFYQAGYIKGLGFVLTSFQHSEAVITLGRTVKQANSIIDKMAIINESKEIYRRRN